MTFMQQLTDVWSVVCEWLIGPGCETTFVDAAATCTHLSFVFPQQPASSASFLGCMNQTKASVPVR